MMFSTGIRPPSGASGSMTLGGRPTVSGSPERGAIVLDLEDPEVLIGLVILAGRLAAVWRVLQAAS
jgi:hypothetical protein